MLGEHELYEAVVSSTDVYAVPRANSATLAGNNYSKHSFEIFASNSTANSHAAVPLGQTEPRSAKQSPMQRGTMHACMSPCAPHRQACSAPSLSKRLQAD